MAHELNGRVLFADGRPASQVRIRVLDRDAPGKGDDDLTLNEGVSDKDGKFTVRFEPSKYLDFKDVDAQGPLNLLFNWERDARPRGLPDLTDLYRPYLQFRYTLKGRPRLHSISLRPFKREFRLPEMLPTRFLPTRDGLKFVNRFRGYFIPFSVPSIPDLPSDTNVYGLCGGMVATSLDFLLAGRPIPPDTQVPKRNSPLHKYIVRRQNDSLGAFGAQVVRFARWMALPDGSTQGTWKKTADEFEEIRPRLDDENPVPIGLVYVSAQDTLQIWKNHQVLAYGYTERNDGTLDVHIYDPNHPLQDDVVVRCERVPVGNTYLPGSPPRVTTHYGLRGVQRVKGRKKKDVRGLFAMPYVPVVPLADL
jgi:hypothetical protein